jgi:hypothetical protein
VSDNAAVLASTFSARFPILLPGKAYTLTIEPGFSTPDFAPLEHFVVSVELLELTTDLPNVMDSELKTAESQSNVNAVAFAISEVALTEIIAGADGKVKWPKFPIGANSHLTMSVGPGDPFHSWFPDSIAETFPPFTYVRVDAKLRALRLIGCLELSIFKTDSPLYAVARAIVGIEAIVTPSMVTQSQTMLQLQFQEARIVVQPFVTVEDENAILQAYPSLAAFEQDIADVIKQINDTQQSYKAVLPTYVASRPLPDLWSNTPGYDITFKKFAYRDVITDGVSVGYLMPLFSVKGLSLPSPCYCEGRDYCTSCAPLLDDAATDAEVSDGCEQLQRASRSVVARSAARTTWPMPDALRIASAASICSLGLSKRSLREIVRSITEIGRKDGFSRGGDLYVSAHWWFRGSLDDVLILEDGLGCVVGVSAEGAVKAAVRDGCGDDIVSASIRLRISVRDVKASWSIGMEVVSHPDPEGSPRELIECSVVGTPSVVIGGLKVEFDSPGDPPQPLPRVDYVLTKATESLKGLIGDEIQKRARLYLIRTMDNPQRAVLKYVKASFVRDSSVNIGFAFRFGD